MTIEQIIDTRDVSRVYQPIVELDTGSVVAYEALARGPKGSSFESPDRMFAAAAAHGLRAQLDWACRAAAIEGALRSGLGRTRRLVINVERR